MKNFDDLESISMIEFITNYLDMEDLLNENVYNLLSKATHKDLKELNIPYVKAVPYEVVTKEDVLEGRVILVYDGKSKGKNLRIAPYIRPQILKEEENLRKGEEAMENDKRQLLFRKEKGSENYKLVFAEKQKFPETTELSLEETAIVVLYPDGGIDVVPFDGVSEMHLENYKKLFVSSKRFADIAKKILLEVNWLINYNTYKFDCKLASLGISLIHNGSIHNMAYDKEYLKNRSASLTVYLPAELTDELNKNMNLILDNHPSEYCLLGEYNKLTGDIDDIDDVDKKEKLL